MKKINFSRLLAQSFQVKNKDSENDPISRLEFLADHIFGFTTYDSKVAETFARKAVEVSAAITEQATFEYIETAENHTWYLLMCNMPFFVGRLDWGASIRGAWWRERIELDSCGLWLDAEQLVDVLDIHVSEWEEFMRAVVAFAAPDHKFFRDC